MATIVAFQRGDVQERAAPALIGLFIMLRQIVLGAALPRRLAMLQAITNLVIQAEATEAAVIKILSWIWRCFKNRLAETSTWGGILLVWFGFIHGSELEMLIGLFAIFVPESIWDAFFEKKGKELKDKLDGKAETTPQ